MTSDSFWLYHNFSIDNTTSASEDSSPTTTWQVVILGLLAAFVSLVTVCGNLIVLLSFFLERSIRQPTYYFIASLAISDLLIGALSMPFYSVYLLAGKKWPLGEVVCDLWLSIDYTVCLCSIYTVFCITIDRYCSVKIPAKYRNWRTERKVVVAVTLTWLIPIFIFFTTIFGWQYFVGKRTVAAMECYVQYMDSAVFNCLLQVGYFWTTLVVMCGLYTGIYRVALGLQQKSNAKQKKMESVVTCANREANRRVATPSKGRSHLQKDQRNEAIEEDEENEERAAEEEEETTEALLSSECCRSISAVDLIHGNRSVTNRDSGSLRNFEYDRSSSPTFPSDTELSSCQSPQVPLHRPTPAPAPVTRKRHPSKRAVNGKRTSAGGAANRLLRLHHPPSERLRKLSQVFFNIHVGRGTEEEGEIGSGNGKGASTDAERQRRESGQGAGLGNLSDGNNCRGQKKVISQPWIDDEGRTANKMAVNWNQNGTDSEFSEEEKERRSPSVTKPRDIGIIQTVNSSERTKACLTDDGDSPDSLDQASLGVSGSPVWKRQSETMEISSNLDRSISQSNQHCVFEKKSGSFTAFPFPPVQSSLTEQGLYTTSTPTGTRRGLDSEESRTCLLPGTPLDTAAVSEPTGTVVGSRGNINATVSGKFSRQNSIDCKRSRRFVRLKFLGGFSVRRRQESLTRNRQRRQLEQRASAADRSSSSSSNREAAARMKKSKSENRARKALRTITIILGVFVICWTPWHLLSLIIGFWSADNGPLAVLYDVSYWLCYLNSPINPLCYALANQQFKKTFTRIIKLDWRRT